MEAFVIKHYRVIFGVLLIAIVLSAFYVGVLEGKQSGADAVTLSCDDAMLSALSIPVASLAQGNTSTVDNATASTIDDGEHTAIDEPQGAFAGSKNGTKYYTPGCAGLKRIKPENIIWFQNAQDATLRGYTPANC
ncbi:MAG TPA: hypothetical protein VG621_02845 [Candidatus Paceibacterota bacterium]|nr:hypothetical protein [Candidatus Paceibacterota bacterium]